VTETPDQTPTPEDRAADRTTVRRRGPDGFALLVGLVCLAASVLTITGRMPGLPDFDPRWVLAAAAVLAGLLMLTASIRGGRRDKAGRTHADGAD
jgi:hypothetical protein